MTMRSFISGLYGASKARFQLKNGAAFHLTQTTEYPFDGKITFSVQESNGVPFRLHVRVPAWAKAAELTVGQNTRKLPCGEYVTIDAAQPEGFTCVLDLHMQPRLTVGHGLIEEDRNQACVEVGPLVYCVESADAGEATSLHDLLLPLDAAFAPVNVTIKGRTVRAYETEALCQQVDEQEREELYRTFAPAPLKPCKIRLIPYYAWDNRGMGEMLVWLPLAWRTL